MVYGIENSKYAINCSSNKIKKLIDIKDDGSFKLDMSFFDFATGLTMTNSKFDNLFENKARKPEEEIN